MTIYDRHAVVSAAECRSVDIVVVGRCNHVHQRRTEFVNALDAGRSVTRGIFCSPLTVDVTGQARSTIVRYVGVKVAQCYVRAVIQLWDTATCRNDVGVVACILNTVASQTIRETCSEVAGKVDVQLDDRYVQGKTETVRIRIVNVNLPSTLCIFAVEYIELVETKQRHDVEVEVSTNVYTLGALDTFVVETSKDRVSKTAATKGIPYGSLCTRRADHSDRSVPGQCLIDVNAKVNVVYSSVNTNRDVEEEALTRVDQLRKITVRCSKLQREGSCLYVVWCEAWEVTWQQRRRAVQYWCKFVFDLHVTPAFVAG